MFMFIRFFYSRPVIQIWYLDRGPNLRKMDIGAYLTKHPPWKKQNVALSLAYFGDKKMYLGPPQKIL